MNSEQQCKQAVRALPGRERPINKTAALRMLLPEIEAAMARGVSQAELVQSLAAAGLTLTLDQLRVILYRIRRPKRKPPDAKSQAAPPATPIPRTPAPSSAGFDYQQYRDKPTDW